MFRSVQRTTTNPVAQQLRSTQQNHYHHHYHQQQQQQHQQQLTSSLSPSYHQTSNASATTNVNNFGYEVGAGQPINNITPTNTIKQQQIQTIHTTTNINTSNTQNNTNYTVESQHSFPVNIYKTHSSLFEQKHPSRKHSQNITPSLNQFHSNQGRQSRVTTRDKLYNRIDKNNLNTSSTNTKPLSPSTRHISTLNTPHTNYNRHKNSIHQQLHSPFSRSSLQQSLNKIKPTPIHHTIAKRGYKRDNIGKDPFDPNHFDPYKTESKDYYRYDFDAKYMDPYLAPEALKRWQEMQGPGGAPSKASFTNLMRQQTRVEANLRRLEDQAHREKVFGAKEEIDGDYWDRDYRELDRRQRELLNKIYREQVESVINEFETDYAPLMAAQLRSQKRAIWWKNMRHRFRFILYPISLAANSFLLAVRLYDRRVQREARVTPRLITEAEYQSFRYKFGFSPKTWFTNRKRFYASAKELTYRTRFMLDAQRELLIMRTRAAQTELIRFRKYSQINNPKDLFLWFTRRSKYDPAQYALRQKITSNIRDSWRRTDLVSGRGLANAHEALVDKRNPTMYLNEIDQAKLGHRVLLKFVLFFRLTAVSYADQPWIVRKLREIVDMYYDVFVPNVFRFFQRFDATRIENRIDRLIQKEIKKQEKLQKQFFKEIEKAKNPNTWTNIKLGISREGSIVKYLRNRFKIWYQKRKTATLYDVAAKNKKYFYGAPAGPPFYRVYLQTKDLLRSPFAHQRVQRLTVGQEDAKSFLRKWGEMNNAMTRHPKLRVLMLQAFHDNLTLRSTIYYRISRYIRLRKPLIDEYRREYFAEPERVFRAIFFKKERYSFQQLYAMALNEWWYPTQQSIKKFDRFDNRWYDRYDDKDSSALFSLSTGLLTLFLWAVAYVNSLGRRHYYEEYAKEQEKYLYTQEGADVSHYVDALLYADKREGILMELKYDGIMRLHDQLCSRMGRMIDNYYSVLGDAMRERYDEFEPGTRLVYSRTELANIANTMKGKERDYEIVEEYILDKVQRLWCDAAIIYAKQFDVTHDPKKYPLEIRQEQADIGHFLMSHIDKIAQAATFPEYEGQTKLSYIIDNGVIKISPTEDEPGLTHERVMSQDQEERLFRYGEDNPANKFLSLSKAVTYIDHSDDCAIAKLARLETNFELLVQLLDAILSIQTQVGEWEETEDRILTIPTSDEIVQLYETGKLEPFLKDWHIKHHRYLPHDFMPENFATLKAKQLYLETGNREVADHFMVYFKKYMEPGAWQPFTDDFGTTEQEFGIKLDPIELLLIESEHYTTTTAQEKVSLMFRPHANLIIQHINRLVQLRPLLYKEVKDAMQVKFPWSFDLDKNVDEWLTGWTPGDGHRLWESRQQLNHYEAYNFTQGTVGKLDLYYKVPLMMAQQLRLEKFRAGNMGLPTSTKVLRPLHPKPSEVSDRTQGRYYDQDDLERAMGNSEFDVDLSNEIRTENMTISIQHALEWKDEYGIMRNPDNWNAVYEQQFFGFSLDELKKRTKAYLQWFTGDMPTSWDTENVSPTGDENVHLVVTPFDRNAYYDAWTDIYTLTARRKDKINSDYKPKGLTIPYVSYITNIKETEMDNEHPDDMTIPVNRIKRMLEGYRFKYDSYQRRTYGTDVEFWGNRSLFYERIDRYFHYFKYFLNRQWSRDILDENQRWRQIKKFVLSGGEPNDSWYEDYFMQQGFRHFLTQDPVFARYGNDFFFRYFIDAPRFDRRPLALLDQHRYDKDGEDVYFDSLYNTRSLNNPYPLNIEHGYWSLKPWQHFVNAQFSVYRYLIVSDGEYPTEFPQMMIHDIQEIEKFVVPDIQLGYDCVHSWGRDLFDTTYKKHIEEVTDYDPTPAMNRPNFLEYDEQYRP